MKYTLPSQVLLTHVSIHHIVTGSAVGALLSVNFIITCKSKCPIVFTSHRHRSTIELQRSELIFAYDNGYLLLVCCRAGLEENSNHYKHGNIKGHVVPNISSFFVIHQSTSLVSYLTNTSSPIIKMRSSFALLLSLVAAPLLTAFTLPGDTTDGTYLAYYNENGQEVHIKYHTKEQIDDAVSKAYPPPESTATPRPQPQSPREPLSKETAKCTVAVGKP
jgi:hypothetical protein